MTGVLIKRGNLDTDTYKKKGNVKAGRMPSTSQATPEATRKVREA